MLLVIPDVLSQEQVAGFARRWTRPVGRRSRHRRATSRRRPRTTRSCRRPTRWRGELGEHRAGCARRAIALFFSAALPRKVFPPLFNRYDGGQSFGIHVDNAIRYDAAAAAQRVRTDLSATLFLCAPDEYDGGELVIEDTYGVQQVKLPAGRHGAVSGEQPAPASSR